MKDDSGLSASPRSSLWAVASCAVGGAVLVWLAQPPAGLSLIAWVAMVPWSLLIARPTALGRGGWWILWSSGCGYWLLTMQGIRLAHPALIPGWIVLSLYLGVYPLLMVGLGRVMYWQWRSPLWLVVPCVWTGLEWIRSYAFTGFSAALLGHSQADVALVTQIADLGGTYVVSFLVASVSSAVASLISGRHGAQRWGGVVLAGAALASTIVYGGWRLRQADALAAKEPLLEALLIQRNEPLVYSMDPEREAVVFNHYLGDTLEAVQKNPAADVVVWPESMYTAGLPYRVLDESWAVPEGIDVSPSEFEQLVKSHQASFRERAAKVRRLMASAARNGQAPDLVVGCSVYRYGDRPQAFGGAVHVDDSAGVAAWYGKMHLVMFGEYIPFGQWFPWLYEVGPLRQGATPGDRPVAMDIAGAQVAPSICFETMVEQVTGRGIRQLVREGRSPDLILNLTNDAWFHGSSILNHHRRCSQLVALANRRPLLMAANQGPTTWIDGSGRRIESLPFETDRVLRAEPRRDGRWSLYQVIGDALAWPLGLLCGCLAVGGLWERRRRRKRN